jgi:hypothetical protein
MRNAINQLSQLGFSKEDCAKALKHCQGHLVSKYIQFTYVKYFYDFVPYRWIIRLLFAFLNRQCLAEKLQKSANMF